MVRTAIRSAMFRGLGLPRVRLNSTKKRTAYVISIPLGTVNMMTFVIISSVLKAPITDFVTHMRMRKHLHGGACSESI